MKAELQDLFKAIKNERTFISCFCNMRDRNEMIDRRCDALQMIYDFEAEYGLSKAMKRFLKHRICTAARETGLM